MRVSKPGSFTGDKDSLAVALCDNPRGREEDSRAAKLSAAAPTTRDSRPLSPSIRREQAYVPIAPEARTGDAQADVGAAVGKWLPRKKYVEFGASAITTV